MQPTLFDLPVLVQSQEQRRSVGLRLRFAIFKRDGFACVYCGRKSPAVDLEVDHVVAVVNGGTNDERNLVTACWDCNRGKSHIPLDKIVEVTARIAPDPVPVVTSKDAGYLAAIGTKGGRSTSEAKAAAARANGAASGGRPRKPLGCVKCDRPTVERLNGKALCEDCRA